MKRFNEKNLLEFDPKSSAQDIKEGLAITDNGRSNGNGKGDRQRYAQVNEQTVARNWCRTFGHKSYNFDLRICTDCGATHEEITAAGEEIKCQHPRCDLPF